MRPAWGRAVLVWSLAFVAVVAFVQVASADTPTKAPAAGKAKEKIEKAKPASGPADKDVASVAASDDIKASKESCSASENGHIRSNTVNGVCYRQMCCKDGSGYTWFFWAKGSPPNQKWCTCSLGETWTVNCSGNAWMIRCN